MIKVNEILTAKTYDWKQPIRILDEEVEIFDKAHKTASITLTYGCRHLSGFNVSVSALPATLITASELIQSLDPRSAYFSACEENNREYFYMFWDEKTTAPIIKGMLGGTLESALKRIENKNVELTDVEISLLEGFIIRILANIRLGFFDVVELRPRISNIQSDLNCIEVDFPEYSMGIYIPLQFRWESEGKILIEGLTHFFYKPEFIRNYNWRKPKWQNLAQSN
jgi:flagellar motor switch protein FliM